MQNSVYLWVDRISERGSFSKMFYHTSICVEFGDQMKIVLSYSENGLAYNPPEQEEHPKEQIYLGCTTKTLFEVVECAENLVATSFRQYDVLKGNCNHFCNEMSVRLCGERIPTKYLVQSAVAVGAGAGITGLVLGAAIVGAVLGVLFRR